MAFQPVPNTIMVAVRGTFQSVPVENTFYFQAAESVTLDMLEDLTGLVNTELEDKWLPILSTGFSLREVYARDLTVQNALQYTNNQLAGEPGAVTGDTLPNQDTIAVYRNSGRTGRSTRGRIFWFGLVESQAANNYVLETVAEDIVDAVQSAGTCGTSLALIPVTVSREQNGVRLATAVTYPVIQWGVTDLRIDSRKSRRPNS